MPTGEPSLVKRDQTSSRACLQTAAVYETLEDALGLEGSLLQAADLAAAHGAFEWAPCLVRLPAIQGLTASRSKICLPSSTAGFSCFLSRSSVFALTATDGLRCSCGLWAAG